MLASRLGDLLVREKMITSKQLEDSLALLKKNGQRLVDVIISQGIADEQNLITFLSKQYRLTIMDLSSVTIEPEILRLLPAVTCVKHGIIPIGRRGDTLVVAVSDPTNIQLLDEIRFNTRLRAEQVLALPSSIRSLLERHYGIDVSKLAQSIEGAEGGELLESQEDVIDCSGDGLSPDDAPIVQFVSAVLVDAIRKKSSDIHIEPYEADFRVRLRIDGDLVDAIRPPPNVKNALVARIKVMAKMRLDEKRLPQDGRVRMKLPEGKIVDFRVNTLPTVHGEKVVLRILDRSAAVVSMEKIGFEADDLAKFNAAIRKPWGICLVTGPTGSGKTTTLYAALNSLNTVDVNISTIEDPVEYNFTGINQVQVKENIGLTFAEALRALLRQDPDIVLLGEIRDGETAEVAFKAALTGHMVLSTLHTNDAPSAVMRLKDMGLDPFLINSALHLVLAQRLVRKICQHCKEPDTRHPPEALLKLGFPQSIIGKFQPMRGKGCSHCRNTGSAGRMAVHEVLVINDKLRERIGAGASTEELRKAAVAEGMRTLKVNGMRKVVAGLMTIDELQAISADG